ncbi:MAG: hypothetical protein QW052_07235 [Candidatus Nitrosocaldaceae archaeon]
MTEHKIEEASSLYVNTIATLLEQQGIKSKPRAEDIKVYYDDTSIDNLVPIDQAKYKILPLSIARDIIIEYADIISANIIADMRSKYRIFVPYNQEYRLTFLLAVKEYSIKTLVEYDYVDKREVYIIMHVQLWVSNHIWFYDISSEFWLYDVKYSQRRLQVADKILAKILRELLPMYSSNNSNGSNNSIIINNAIMISNKKTITNVVKEAIKPYIYRDKIPIKIYYYNSEYYLPLDLTKNIIKTYRQYIIEEAKQYINAHIGRNKVAAKRCVVTVRSIRFRPNKKKDNNNIAVEISLVFQLIIYRPKYGKGKIGYVFGVDLDFVLNAYRRYKVRRKAAKKLADMIKAYILITT